MDFLVFGATGRTGSAFVRQALAAGHVVDAFVRDAGAALPGGAKAVVGDVMDPATLARAVDARHVLVVTLGGPDALTAGCANVIRAASTAGAKRLLGVVGAGVLQADATRLRSEAPDYPPPLRPIGAAHRAFYEALVASPLEWTLACTPRLKAGERTNAMRTKPDYFPEGTGEVTTEDVAAFLLEAATSEPPVRGRVGVNGA